MAPSGPGERIPWFPFCHGVSASLYVFAVASSPGANYFHVIYTKSSKNPNKLVSLTTVTPPGQIFCPGARKRRRRDTVENLEKGQVEQGEGERGGNLFAARPAWLESSTFSPAAEGEDARGRSLGGWGRGGGMNAGGSHLVKGVTLCSLSARARRALSGCCH